MLENQQFRTENMDFSLFYFKNSISASWIDNLVKKSRENVKNWLSYSIFPVAKKDSYFGVQFQPIRSEI